MVAAESFSIDAIVTLTEQLQTENFRADEQKLLEVVHRNALELKKYNLNEMNMIGLSTKSHDIRQPLTAIVGYSALLNSPKLANHNNMKPEQIEQIYQLHDLCRHFHWHVDNLILFSTYIVRPKSKKSLDAGMLDIRGYLLAQADNYVCRSHVTEENVPEEIPFVYANDAKTKLMIRGLFTAALDIGNSPELHLSVYTMMKVVRAKLCVVGQAEQYEKVIKHLKVKKVPSEKSASSTHAMIATLSSMNLTSMLELGIYIATNLAEVQGGRVKVETDQDDLVFTLTMPTVPKF